jgi:Family of unknown function (DUF6427)
MITTIFKKSSPINYTLVGILMFLFFSLSQFTLNTTGFSVYQILPKTLVLLLLIATIVVTNFITKKNALSKDSTYTVLFSFLFLVFFPNLFNDPNLVFANFLIILAMRRLIALQSLKFPKEKIFDASLFIFFASLFYFWSILFIILVFAAITLHVSRDYRNWILPFIAFFAVIIVFVFFALLIDKAAIDNFLIKTDYCFEINYFTSIYQNIAFSLFITTALFFMTTLFLTLSNKPLIQNSSFKKLIIWFFIGLIIYIIAPYKSNDVLIFTFAPLAIIATSFIETIQIKWQQELTLSLVIICSFFCFFTQL